MYYMEKIPSVSTKTIRGQKRDRMRGLAARNRKGTGGDPGVRMNGRMSPKMSLRLVDSAKKMSEPDWDQVPLNELRAADAAATHRMSGGEWTKWEAVRKRIRSAICKQELELAKQSK